ncbi:MAG: hypothetical protein IPN31_00490 [Bacteroidetes bacterium]|nr:hypothetical protein [Bacteroidota bacterium]
MSNKQIKYNAGVLIIGSLYWDSNNARDTWRLNAFGESYWLHKKEIQVPLFYGRYSIERKCPTMIIRSSYHIEGEYGTGIFMPFRRRNLTNDQLLLYAQDLSEAEGRNSQDFIKGNDVKWCIVLAWLNPNLEVEKRNSFIEFWKSQYVPPIDESIMNNFKYDNEDSSVFDENGLLQLEWPNGLEDIDIVFLTQTKPRLEGGGKLSSPSVNTLANQIFLHPEYFIKNRLNGIITVDDNAIIALIKERDRADLIAKAINNGCSQNDIDLFFQNEGFNIEV